LTKKPYTTELYFDDMLRLSSDKDNLVTETAVKTLELVYPHVPDRKKLWTKLAGLTASQAPGRLRGCVMQRCMLFHPLIF